MERPKHFCHCGNPKRRESKLCPKCAEMKHQEDCRKRSERMRYNEDRGIGYAALVLSYNVDARRNEDMLPPILASDYGYIASGGRRNVRSED